MEDSLTPQLSESEKVELETLEGIIEKSVKSFVDVGKALLAIRDKGLYREGFKTFEEYCRDKWGMSRQYSYRLIGASLVAANLSPHVDTMSTCEIRPTSEYQIRPLFALEPAQQCEIWEEAVRSAGGKVVTFKQVNALVKERIGGTIRTVTEIKPPKRFSNAMQVATFVISHLQGILPDDPQRATALGRVSEWINQHL